MPERPHSRRAFLGTAGLSMFSLGSRPRFLQRLAAGLPASSAGGRPKTLVSIFLRGAMDGLMAVPPLDDALLRPYRPRLTMSGAASSPAPLLDLDGRFGLHPAFEALYPAWQSRQLAVVHAVGSPSPTRSHFDAQDYMESGTPDLRVTGSGWLNRLAWEIRPAADATFGLVSMTDSLPRSLQGEHPALALEDLATFELRLPAWDDTDELLRRLYRDAPERLLRSSGQRIFDALRLLDRRELDAYRAERAARYPRSPLGRALLQIAFLIKSGIGLRLAFAESTGWDTHVRQGTGRGAFAARASDLALSIAAFWRDLELYQDDVVVLTMTEFGRTVRQNGSGGTDHGHGSCLFVLGNRVDGGRVHGVLPELVPENLFEGRDLPVTTDFRAAFAGVVGPLFGVEDDQRLFPGWSGARLPLLW